MIALAAAALAAVLAAPAPAALAPHPSPLGPDEAAKVETRCASCHTAEGWDRVTFDHARTGFALEGAHRKGACRGCHPQSDFRRPVPKACVACHRDGHAGRLGTRCQDCHDAVAWGEPAFGPEQHRRTAFPLEGRHALLPCEECHGNRRDRSFARATPRCVACHEPDLARAASGFFDHAALGLAGDCNRCHGPWRFAEAYLPGHDACFPIRSGTHSGIRCLQCHPSLTAADFQGGGVCSTAVPAGCTRCHGTCPPGHSCPVTDTGCYRCHPGGSAGG